MTNKSPTDSPTSTAARATAVSRRLCTRAVLPTPLQRLDKLSDLLGGPEIWIKRDDCTGLAGGGNKVRKLVWLIADAVIRAADLVITSGAPQSNHARQTAAAAAMCGLGCELILQRGVAHRTAEYERCGNILLDHIFGADITFVAADADVNGTITARLHALADAGVRAYVIPAGGSKALGAKGYVDCAAELGRQFSTERIRPDTILHATGSGGTQAGLIFGLHTAGIATQVRRISIAAPRDEQTLEVKLLLHDLARDREAAPVSWPVTVDDRYIGGGYGQPTSEGVAAVRTVAMLEGVLLDPVYTGKAMAALIDAVQKTPSLLGDTVVFLHTGGAHALHGYPADFSNPQRPNDEGKS